MKKILAALLLIAVMSGLVWTGYQQSHNIWSALLMIPMCIVFGGIGGAIGIFFMNTFFGKQ
jgi:hypothetical protein